MYENSVKWYSTTKDDIWCKADVKTYDTKSGEKDFLKITDEKYQKIDGFGGCFNELGWIALSKLGEVKRNEILDILFNEEGLNFNYCRLPIGANDYSERWYSHSEVENDYAMEHHSIERDRKYLIPYIHEGLKRRPDMKLFASPWSPPVWMKFPKAHNFGTLLWTKENLEAYAIYFLKFIEAYKKEGIRIDQVHVQNEPMSTQKFPSCIWSGKQMCEFIGEYLGPLFEEKGLETTIWLGTLNGPEKDARKLYTDYDDYANLVLSDDKAGRFVEGVSYQWAGKSAIARTYESWPDVKLMQSENECGDGYNSWEYAGYVFNLLRHYLANGAGSYMYWNMVLEPGGASTWGWNQNTMITVDAQKDDYVLNPEFYAMMHFSRFIKPGAIRSGIRGNLSGNTVAFENADGSRIVVINNGMDKKRKVEIELVKGCFSVELKPRSFNTFII